MLLNGRSLGFLDDRGGGGLSLGQGLGPRFAVGVEVGRLADAHGSVAEAFPKSLVIESGRVEGTAVIPDGLDILLIYNTAYQLAQLVCSHV